MDRDCQDEAIQSVPTTQTHPATLGIWPNVLQSLVLLSTVCHGHQLFKTSIFCFPYSHSPKWESQGRARGLGITFPFPSSCFTGKSDSPICPSPPCPICWHEQGLTLQHFKGSLKEMAELWRNSEGEKNRKSKKKKERERKSCSSLRAGWSAELSS